MKNRIKAALKALRGRPVIYGNTFSGNTNYAITITNSTPGTFIANNTIKRQNDTR